MARILIIDDDDLVQKTLERFLRKSGYAVSVLCNGDGIFKKLSEINPDLILLDIGLSSQFDGFDICKLIRSSENKVKIVVYTGYLDKINTRQSRLAGADDCIPKPTDAKELLLTIERVLNAE